MRLVLLRNSSFLAATFALGFAVATIGAPVWKSILMEWNQDAFGELTYRCDHAMRAHMIAKQKLVANPSEESVREVEAMEIGLLDCQNYDLMRKRLIRWGLSDNELSEMSLRAIEDGAGSLQEVVRVHEIRY
ncbi:hypothetical protein C8N35_104209 [Breoghania corrubedonensis]|uniref:Uncharacterized protein n=1 Tax=Breoghania corrubedonensis TaxID=665038 RepID=A0A2T5VA26_9HYPH|nr:TIGR03982 family His-Xaa-Ser system protein [Breoghania corrubedonensis]PTW60584.1 hypothetical protein C8N35_104209 [Breoghania corrubedonensis]